MVKIVKQMMRSLRKAITLGSKKRSTRKNTKKTYNHKGGALYSFNLLDKIGGLPAQLGLNGTVDGDCPKGNDTDFGRNNYAITKGGSRKNKMNRRSKKTKKVKVVKKSKSGKSKSGKSKSGKSKSRKSKSRKSKSGKSKSRKSKSGKSKKSKSKKH